MYRRDVGRGTLGLSCGVWHQSVGVGVDSLSPLGCEECILMIVFLSESFTTDGITNV